MRTRKWSMRMLKAGAAACVAAGPVLAQDSGDDSADWTRNFRVGLAVGYNISANFKFGGTYGVSGANPGATGVSGVNHVFDDGYVKVDATGNAGGYTSYWGYTSASQYNPATQQITMHGTTSFTTAGKETADDPPYLGLDMTYGGIVYESVIGRVGWELGFDMMPFAIKDSQTLQGTFVRTVDTFSTGGIVIPGAPYSGGASGIGPTIHDVATPLPSQSLSGSVGGVRTLQGTMYEVRLGPTLFVPVGTRWTFSGAIGPALGLIPADYKYNETIHYSDGSQARNQGQFGKFPIQYGGYASAMAYFRIDTGADLYAGVQAMSLGKGRYESSGREADLNLAAGLLFSVGINWPF